jgi:hypothetical protein
LVVSSAVAWGGALVTASLVTSVGASVEVRWILVVGVGAVTGVVTLWVASGIGDSIKSRRSPGLMLCVLFMLMLTHLFLIWFSFLGGWRVFTG